VVGASGFEPPTSWSRTRHLNPINALSGIAYGTRSVISPLLVVPKLYLPSGESRALNGFPISGCGFDSHRPLHKPCVQSGDILYRTFLRHSLHFWTKRVVQGLQSLLLKIDVTEIIVHKAYQPDTVVDLLDAHGLTRESGT